MKAFHDLPLPVPLHDALREVSDRLTAAFRVDRLMLFGPVVRGEADEESDADLLVVLMERPTHQERDRITSLILDVNLEYGTNLSELIVGRETWDRGVPSVLPLHAEIEAEGIRL